MSIFERVNAQADANKAGHGARMASLCAQHFARHGDPDNVSPERQRVDWYLSIQWKRDSGSPALARRTQAEDAGWTLTVQGEGQTVYRPTEDAAVRRLWKLSPLARAVLDTLSAQQRTQMHIDLLREIALETCAPIPLALLHRRRGQRVRRNKYGIPIRDDAGYVFDSLAI